jgi:hypothetical protein
MPVDEPDTGFRGVFGRDAFAVGDLPDCYWGLNGYKVLSQVSPSPLI